MMAAHGSDEITISVNETDLKPGKSKQKSKTSQWDDKITEISAAICALLNSSRGGYLRLVFGKDCLAINEPKTIDDFVRRIEQSAMSFAGVATVSNEFKLEDKDINAGLKFKIQSARNFCTIEYNLYLPTEFQVSAVTKADSASIAALLKSKNCNNAITFPEHCKHFNYQEKMPLGLREGQTAQFKLLKNEATKSVSLADRMTNKSNKMVHCVSAFANHHGGKVYYGVDDKTYKIEGQEFNSKEQEKIINKVSKTLGNMSWSVKEHKKFWRLDFVPVLTDGEHRNDTFVVVLSVAKCPGGVFVDEPESYHLVDGKVSRITLATWKQKFIASNRGNGDNNGSSSGQNGTNISHGVSDLVCGCDNGRITNSVGGFFSSGSSIQSGINQNDSGDLAKYQCGNGVNSTNIGHCSGCICGDVAGPNAMHSPTRHWNDAHPNNGQSGGAPLCFGNKNSNMTLVGIPKRVAVKCWNSPKQEEDYMKVTELMENLRNNGDWKEIDRIAANILVPGNRNADLRLTVIFQCIAAAYRQTKNNNAYSLLESYHNTIKFSKNPALFEVQELYSRSAIKRSERDYHESYKYTYDALQQMQLISPGWITAWFLCNAAALLTIFASEATDVMMKLSQMDEAKCYYIAALEHAKSITDYEKAAANLRHRVHINLAMLYMESSPNIRSVNIKQTVEPSNLKSAHKSLVAAETFEGPPMTGFNEFYFLLAKSDLYYRYFQLSPETKQEHVKKAISYAKEASGVATTNDFTEVLHFAEARVKLFKSITLVEQNAVDELLNNLVQ